MISGGTAGDCAHWRRTRCSLCACSPKLPLLHISSKSVRLGVEQIHDRLWTLTSIMVLLYTLLVVARRAPMLFVTTP